MTSPIFTPGDDFLTIAKCSLCNGQISNIVRIYVKSNKFNRDLILTSIFATEFLS